MRLFKWQGRKALAEYQEACREQGKSPKQIRREKLKVLPANKFMSPVPAEAKAKMFFLEGDFVGMTPRQVKREKSRLIKAMAA